MPNSGKTPLDYKTNQKPMFIAEAERKPGFVHVLLITTGSVASVKAPLIVKDLHTVSFAPTSVVTTYLV